MTVTIHTSADLPVAGVTVTGTWSDAAQGSASCVTGASGVCSVTKSNLKSNQSTATFTVTQVGDVDAVYDAIANHDPDGDSDGTSISIAAP